MSAARDSCVLLARVTPVEIDGAKWWPLREVCDALHCSNYQAAARLVDPAHKRVVRTTHKGGRFLGYAQNMIDREGVERLAICYGGRTPRALLMAALANEQ